MRPLYGNPRLAIIIRARLRLLNKELLQMSDENVARESRFALLPTYLALDTSVSMTEDGAFASAFGFLPKLLAEMNKSAVINDKLRVEVITFDETARVVFPLGTRDELKNWLDETKDRPVVPDGNWTKYGRAFDRLREEIEHGVTQIRSESYEGENYKAYRPVVFFITDGEPNDDESARNEAYARLTDAGFKSRPNIVCVGVGRASLEKLKDYGAGCYESPIGGYVTGNGKLTLVSRDGVSPTAALDAIIPALIQSVIASIGNVGAINATADDGMEDPFGENRDELFDEDVFEAFEQGV